VTQLQEAIRNEKLLKLKQRNKERQEAQQVIQLNELAREQLYKQHLQEKDKENEMVRAYQRAEEQKE
jgi:hypothetical protein